MFPLIIIGPVIEAVATVIVTAAVKKLLNDEMEGTRHGKD